MTKSEFKKIKVGDSLYWNDNRKDRGVVIKKKEAFITIYWFYERFGDDNITRMMGPSIMTHDLDDSHILDFLS